MGMTKKVKNDKGTESTVEVVALTSSFDAKGLPVKGSDGVTDMVNSLSNDPYFGAGKNREYVGAAATRQRFTWPIGNGPTKILIRVYTAAASANLPLEEISCCFDAESTTVADVNLAQTGSADVDMQNEVVQVADGWYEKTFTAPLETMDFIVETATISAVRVVGV